MPATKYASISWSVDDVMENAIQFGITLTRHQAQNLLRKQEKHIEEAMVEAGWAAIEAALVKQT